MTTKLQIARARARVSLAEISGKRLPADVIRAAKLEFSDAEEVVAPESGSAVQSDSSAQDHLDRQARVISVDGREVLLDLKGTKPIVTSSLFAVRQVTQEQLEAGFLKVGSSHHLLDLDKNAQLWVSSKEGAFDKVEQSKSTSVRPRGVSASGD